MIEIKLLSEFSRQTNLKDTYPLFTLMVKEKSIKVLYTTNTPYTIWCKSAKAFEDLFPNAIRLIGCYALESKAKLIVYVIPMLNIHGMKVQNLPVVINPIKSVGDLLLQANIFSNSVVQLDYKNRVMCIDYFKPVRMCKVIKNGIYIGSMVYIEDTCDIYVKYVELEDIIIPEDFKSYAIRNGSSIDELAKRIYDCMPLVYRDTDVDILTNALKGWESFRKYL